MIIVGAGKIGAALAQYEGFRQRGFQRGRPLRLRSGEDRARDGTDLEVRDIDSLAEDNRERPVDIAVLAVPAEAAQRVVDRLVAAGITGILSFAPIQLHVPSDVTLNTVNMAMELERLSFALSNRE